ncbi:5161_t:CDS:2, partial [Acaulospora colombiana]
MARLMPYSAVLDLTILGKDPKETTRLKQLGGLWYKSIHVSGMLMNEWRLNDSVESALALRAAPASKQAAARIGTSKIYTKRVVWGQTPSVAQNDSGNEVPTSQNQYEGSSEDTEFQLMKVYYDKNEWRNLSNILRALCRTLPPDSEEEDRRPLYSWSLNPSQMSQTLAATFKLIETLRRSLSSYKLSQLSYTFSGSIRETAYIFYGRIYTPLSCLSSSRKDSIDTEKMTSNVPSNDRSNSYSLPHGQQFV